MIELIKAFMGKLGKQGLVYTRSVLITLEINKLESQHQKADVPPIFNKTIDEFGIVESFTVNPAYLDVVPIPRTNFSNTDYQGFIELLDETNNDFLDRLVVMLSIGSIEHFILSQILEDAPRDTPFIMKKCDEHGFPIEYMLNVDGKISRGE